MSAGAFRRRRRPRMPKVIDFKLIPVTLWLVLATVFLAGQAATTVWGVQRGILVGLAVAAVGFGPRQHRVNWMTSAAFFLADEVLHIDQWEARRGNRWRSRLQKVGVQRDFSFWGQQTTAARKGKWVRIKLHPFSLWPQGEHIRAVSIRVPPPRRVVAVEDHLTEAMAEFFNVGKAQLRHTVRRAWMRTWVTFTVVNGPTVARPRSYLDVLDR